MVVRSESILLWAEQSTKKIHSRNYSSRKTASTATKPNVTDVSRYSSKTLNEAQGHIISIELINGDTWEAIRK